MGAAMLALLVPCARAAAIVGGFESKTPWPAFAQLVLKGDAQCGASLIRHQWIVTGAHCVIGHSPSDYTVIVGSSRRNVGEQVPVKSITMHPGYAQETIPVLKAAWDVAVLELAHPVSVPPIRIPSPAEAQLFKAGTPAVTIGLGDDGIAPTQQRKTLWEADIPIVSDTDCNIEYAGRFDPEEHICAGRGDGNGTCNGDSGGPLMVKDANGAFVLVGDVSFGIGCATPGTYDVFARVASPTLHRWIDEHAGPLDAPAPATLPPAAPPAHPKPSTAAARSGPARARSRGCGDRHGHAARPRCRQRARRHKHR